MTCASIDKLQVLRGRFIGNSDELRTDQEQGTSEDEMNDSDTIEEIRGGARDARSIGSVQRDDCARLTSRTLDSSRSKVSRRLRDMKGTAHRGRDPSHLSCEAQI